MRRFLAAVLAVLAMAALCGCAPTEAILYENEFDDLDIEGRCDDVVSMVKSGMMGGYVRRDIEAIKNDLLFIEPDNEDLKKINDMFIASVDEIMEYREAAVEQDERGMREHLEGARYLYRRADNRLNEIKRQYDSERKNELESG